MDLVVDAVQQPWDDREERRLQGLDVVHQERDVPLVETYPGSMAEHGDLEEKEYRK